MFRELFETMHEMLDAIAMEYEGADGEKREDLHQKLDVLKEMSNDCIEQWLAFEEKLGCIEQQSALSKPNPNLETESLWEEPAVYSESFQKGEGYFKLLMFREANEHFKQVVQQYPEFMMARVYLALGFIEIKEYEEALRHLQLIIPLTNDQRLKAIAYHAMGCIEIHKNHIEKACEYFKKARNTDPSLSYYSLS